MYDDKFGDTFNNIKENGVTDKGNITESDTSATNKSERKQGTLPLTRSAKKVEPERTASQADVDAAENLKKANQKLQDAKTKRDTETQANTAKRRELKGQAKENMKGREGGSVLDNASATDSYLDAMLDNKTIFDATGKRTSKETGLDLQRVIKKGDDYFFDDDKHGKLQKKNDAWVFEDGTAPEEATQFDYQQWAKDGKREGTKTAGRGFNQRLANAIQRTVYKKVIQDMFAPEEFEAIRGQLKNKKLASIEDIEFNPTEKTIIDVIYTPVVLGGEQGTQNRKIFAGTWAQAEAKAKDAFSSVVNTSAVNEARKEVKQFKSAVDAHDKAYEKQLKEEAGPKPRTAEIVKSGGWTGFKVSGEGANTSYMGRVETDDEGNKVFRVYGADKRSNVEIPSDDDAAWIEGHVPDTYRDPIFEMAITEANPLDYVTNMAAMAVEGNTGKVEGKYKNQNAKIKGAKNNLILDMYNGKNILEFLNADKGKERAAKIVNDKDEFIKVLTQLQKYGIDVSAENFEMGPAGSFYTDMLSKMQGSKDFAKEVAGVDSEEYKLKHGYVKQEDGTLIKTYKPDDPNTKTNRAKINTRGYGVGSTVKDKKTGKYLGETAQAERIRKTEEPAKTVMPGLGLLGALGRR